MNEKRAQNPWITCGKLLKWRLYIHLSMHVRWATVCSSQKHFYYLQPNLDIWCSLFCWINPTFKPIHLCVASDTVYGYSQWSHQCYIFFSCTNANPFSSISLGFTYSNIGSYRMDKWVSTCVFQMHAPNQFTFTRSKRIFLLSLDYDFDVRKADGWMLSV